MKSGPNPNSSYGVGRNGTAGSATSWGLIAMRRCVGQAAASGRAVRGLALISQSSPATPGGFCMVTPVEGGMGRRTSGNGGFRTRSHEVPDTTQHDMNL
ncbi:hypothetical protein GCM10010345_72590 [Streptomyces canarius]|uniref:Uncharacterized protein n=1 Tax=Streptomyces canarius TaxID=285453 RepID=A0ABQ3D5B8_9ACTN|nr:hypothetical protein GCM10010345_72590 [Streptomyces canarius]